MITVAFARGAERYDGPLDLLLALVRQHRYPLDALPIAQITRQYDAYLRQAKRKRLVMAACTGRAVDASMASWWNQSLR